MRYLLPRTIVVVLSVVGYLFVSHAPTFAGKYPEPSIYPISWELNFKHSAPKRVVLDVPGRSTPTAFWYMTYTVVNNTKTDQYFSPRFDMLTEDGRVFRSDDRRISPPVINEIRKRERNPALKSAADLVKEPKLLQGDDQAKEGMAVWEEPMANMRSFTIFVSGLSGEFVKMKDDDGKEMKDSEGSPIFLRKTLELGYTIHGGGGAPDEDQIQAKPEKWVMR